jgi:hypothetical protein
MSDKIQKSTLSGILGTLIATSGMVGSALSRDPIYAICSFVLAPIVIVWMNVGRKTLNRSILRTAEDPVERFLKEQGATAKARQAFREASWARWEPILSYIPQSGLSATSVQIPEPRLQSNLRASSETSETASSAETKLVDAPA